MQPKKYKFTFTVTAVFDEEEIWPENKPIDPGDELKRAEAHASELLHEIDYDTVDLKITPIN